MKNEEPVLPAPAAGLLAEYCQLVADIDGIVAQMIAGRWKDLLQCRPGCASCCISFAVLPLEGALIVEYMKKEGIVAGGSQLAHCPLLGNGLCKIYPVRPVICRTQGLALGYAGESSGSIEVSACPLNFGEEFEFTVDELVMMDHFNMRLALLNIQYCKASGLDAGERIDLDRLASSPR